VTNLISIKDIHAGEADAFIASYTGNGASIKLAAKARLISFSKVTFLITYKHGKQSEQIAYDRIEDAVENYNKLVALHTQEPVPPMKFKVGDRVAFVNRAQDGYGHTIDAVDPVARKYRTQGYKWWVEANFMPWSEWEAKHGAR
jgi:hypothetical protein